MKRKRARVKKGDRRLFVLPDVHFYLLYECLKHVGWLERSETHLIDYADMPPAAHSGFAAAVGGESAGRAGG